MRSLLINKKESVKILYGLIPIFLQKGESQYSKWGQCQVENKFHLKESVRWNFRSFPGGSSCRGQGEAKERGSHPRWVGSSFHKQRNLHTRFIWPSQNEYILVPPSRIWKVYIGGSGSHCEHSERNYIPRTGEGEEPRFPGSCSWVNQKSWPLHDLLVTSSYNLAWPRSSAVGPEQSGRDCIRREAAHLAASRLTGSR